MRTPKTSSTRQTVSFDSAGSTIVADLYAPAALAGGDRLPGIVVSGSWTTVKEQMAGLYAERLAARGFAALAFDFRHWGASGGEPRQLESPRRKIEDIAAAASFLQARPEVAQVGGLAICASAGYMAHAIAAGAPLRSLVLVASWLHDPDSVGAVYGGESGVRQRLEDASRARRAAEHGEAVAYVPAYDPDDPHAAMFFPLDYYARGDRGAVPEWTNRFAVASWTEWLTFDAIGAAGGVRVPTLMVHADAAALPDNARRFFAALPGPKDLLWTSGAQTDFYDLAPQVDMAVDAAVGHFSRTLGPPAGSGRLSDRQGISDVVTALLHAIDRQDWTGVRRTLADEVRTDYTSLFGGTVEIVSGDLLLHRWQALLPGFDATQHLTGPVIADVSGDTARASCAVTAVHRIDAAHWTVSGHYELELVRRAGAWAISAIAYRSALVAGDTSLPAQAASRAAARGARSRGATAAPDT